MDRLVCLTTTRYGTQGRFESRSRSLGLIKLDKKQTGAPSAGNLHAGCDVAGTGNGSTATPKRARRGKPRIQAKEQPTRYRASPRPYHRAVTQVNPQVASKSKIRRSSPRLQG